MRREPRPTVGPRLGYAISEGRRASQFTAELARAGHTGVSIRCGGGDSEDSVTGPD